MKWTKKCCQTCCCYIPVFQTTSLYQKAVKKNPMCLQLWKNVKSILSLLMATSILLVFSLINNLKCCKLN